MDGQDAQDRAGRCNFNPILSILSIHVKKNNQEGRRQPEAEEEILTGEKFDAMTDRQRAKMFADLESETPEQRQDRSKPMNAEERAWWKRVQKKLQPGRPKFGKNGTRIVSVTVEKALLKHADAHAKARGMK